jgi:hypothetical protein
MLAVGVTFWWIGEVHQQNDFSELKILLKVLTYLSEEPKGLEWPKDGECVEHK